MQPPLPSVTWRYPGIPKHILNRIAADQRLPGGARYVTGPQRVLSEEAGRAAEEGPSEVMPSWGAACSLVRSTRQTHPPLPTLSPLEAVTTRSSSLWARVLRQTPCLALGPKSRRRMQVPPTLPVSSAAGYPALPADRPPRVPAVPSTRLPQLRRRNRHILPVLRLCPTLDPMIRRRPMTRLSRPMAANRPCPHPCRRPVSPPT